MFKYIFPVVLAIVCFLVLAAIFGTFNSNEWEQTTKIGVLFMWFFISGIGFAVETSEGR